MKTFFTKPWIFVAILAIGIFFKVYKIDQKFYWYDEIATIEHTSGYQIEPLEKNKILPITAYKEQLRLNRHNYKFITLFENFRVKTNLNPLHYPLLMIWIRIVGDEPVSYRWFNVFIFLLTLPILFLLARKLFKNPMAGWVAITIYACSPFINFFTHEARYHITWAFFLLLTCYLFLKALEDNKLKWWLAYTVASTCTMHMSLISIPSLAGLFLWGFFYHKQYRKQVFISSALAFLIYVPWILLLYANRNEITGALSWHSIVGQDVPFFKLLYAQVIVPAKSFWVPVDFMRFRFPRSNFRWIELISLFPLLLIHVAVVYSVWKKNRNAGVFLIFVVLPMILFFVISDTIRGVGGSMIHRYQVINVVGAILFVSYFLSAKMAENKWPAFVAYFLIIGMGVYTMINFSKNPVWDMPGQHRCKQTITEGEFYSSKDSPLIISDFKNLPMGLGYIKVLEITNAYQSDNIDILHATSDIENITSYVESKNYTDVYISLSSDQFVNHLKQTYGDKIVKVELDGAAPVWQIKK